MHFIDYHKNEPVSIELPENAKLIVTCSENITGKAKCIIKERKTFPQKNFAFVPNFSDTNKVAIIPGSENLIYQNSTNATCLIQFRVVNHLVFNDNNHQLSIFPDVISCFVKSPYENENIIKPRKKLMLIDSGMQKNLTYSLPPGFSLFLANNNYNNTGFAFYQVKALAF